jgi:hypothetical protein
MSRKEQILTTEQIDEVLNNAPGKIKILTWKAVQNFLLHEKDRRNNVRKTAGRKRIYEGDAKERNRQSSKTYRKNKNTLDKIRKSQTSN